MGHRSARASVASIVLSSEWFAVQRYVESIVSGRGDDRQIGYITVRDQHVLWRAAAGRGSIAIQGKRGGQRKKETDGSYKSPDSRGHSGSQRGFQRRGVKSGTRQRTAFKHGSHMYRHCCLTLSSTTPTLFSPLSKRARTDTPAASPDQRQNVIHHWHTVDNTFLPIKTFQAQTALCFLP